MPHHAREAIPVIDLFAGPGGLGEGFAAFHKRKRKPFRPALSIEKDPAAYKTLKLRSFFRLCPPNSPARETYYRLLRNEITLDQLYQAYPRRAAQAGRESWCAELGEEPLIEIRHRIRAALHDAPPWVLLGGPPCQPFSLAGRSRNRRGTRYSQGRETRHTLYREYLRPTRSCAMLPLWPSSRIGHGSRHSSRSASTAELPSESSTSTTRTSSLWPND